jgi:hypothetical protein
MKETRGILFVHGEITGRETKVKQSSMMVVVKMDFTAPVGKVFVDRLIQKMHKCADLALRAQGAWVDGTKTIIATLPEVPLEEFFENFIASFLEFVAAYVPANPLPANQSDQVILELTVCRASTITERKVGLIFELPKLSTGKFPSTDKTVDI